MDCEKILLIEDNPADARLVREALLEAGCSAQLKHCSSLQEAIRHLEQGAADVILLDLGLPDATGLEGMSEIDRVAPRTPIIILTGNDDDAEALRALRRGAQDHLVKGSCDGDALLRSIRHALGRQGTANLRSDLLAALARELKAPVDTLHESLRLLLETNGAALSERQRTMLQRVHNTVETLRRFHEGMLDMAREEDGPMRYQLAGLGGARVVEEIKRRMARKLAELEGDGSEPAQSFAEHSLDGSTDFWAPAAHETLPERIFLLEDNPGDARLIAEILAEAGIAAPVDRSPCLSDAAQRLAQATYDVALIDLGLPDASALEAVSEVTRLAPRTPVLVITGRDDDTAADAALRHGAQDYLVKGRIDAEALRRSIRFARERQRTVNLRSELLEAIAFELRHPIHVVLGYVHLLLETIPDPLREDHAKILYEVLDTTQTLRRLAEAMLDVAGAERGPLRREISQAGVAKVIEALKQNMANRLAASVVERRIERMPPPGASPSGSRPGRLFRRMLGRLAPQRKQVLVVDPDYDSRTILKTALEGGHYEVVEAEKEADVLRHLVSENVQLAVVEPQAPDIAMPGVLDEVRKIATFFKVPLVLLDTGEAEGKVGRSQDTAQEFHISKPFTPEQFLFAVDHVLGRA